MDKLTGYEHLAHVGPTYPVLFCLPSRERERNLHTELAGHRGRITVATAVHPLPGPSDAVWAIVGHGTANRWRLADLASDHGPANPGNPVYRSGFIDPPDPRITE